MSNGSGLKIFRYSSKSRRSSLDMGYRHLSLMDGSRSSLMFSSAHWSLDLLVLPVRQLVGHASCPVVVPGIAVSLGIAPSIVLDAFRIEEKAPVSAAFKAHFDRIELARSDFKFIRTVFTVVRVSRAVSLAIANRTASARNHYANKALSPRYHLAAVPCKPSGRRRDWPWYRDHSRHA